MNTKQYCSSQRSGSVFKQIEELEYTLKKSEEEKSQLKQENASLVSVNFYY